jgi:hypothetical protein
VDAVKKSPIALAIAALLFGGWIAYLGVEASRKSKPVIVSRAQLLAAQYDVEADLDLGPDGKLPESVTVRSVLYGVDQTLPADEITIGNISQAIGYSRPGTYLLPLVRKGKKAYEVATVPLDPGYPPGRDPPPPRIYPLTAEVRLQQQQARGH